MQPSTVLKILPAAQEDIDDTAEYIAQDRLAAGLAFLEAIADTLQQLLEIPLIGRERAEFAHERLTGLRSLPVRGFENWLVFYRLTQDGIEVIRVLHGARELGAVLMSDGWM